MEIHSKSEKISSAYVSECLCERQSMCALVCTCEREIEEERKTERNKKRKKGRG
jgi:hypothetical protein